MRRIAQLWVIGAAVAAPIVGEAQGRVPVHVQVQMRQVDFHVDSVIVLHIEYLRGELRRSSPDNPAYLDDKLSFLLGIDSAKIGVTPAGLGDLLNHYTFAYPGSPLRKLTFTIDHGHLRQQGLLQGISFTVMGDLTLTPDGELRLHPSSVKAVGIKVGGLMKLFGLHLQKLVDTKRALGVRIDGDDFLLSPAELLPPPKIEGRLSAVEVTDSEIVQVFTSAGGRSSKPLAPPTLKAANYMFFRGGVLRFGKLTMTDTDLYIVDAEPHDRFDFFLDDYNQQLVAGYSRNTADHGLIVVMPDFRRTRPLRQAPGKLP